MAVKLRLKRMGKTHRPHYRICAIDSRKARGGEYIESIGHYDPLILDDQKKVTIDQERAAYWLSVGAQPSETVASFLRKLQVAGAGTARPRKKRRKRTAGKAGKRAAGAKKAER